MPPIGKIYFNKNKVAGLTALLENLYLDGNFPCQRKTKWTLGIFLEGWGEAFVFQRDAKKKKKSEIIMQYETNAVFRERALLQVVPWPSLMGAEFPRAWPEQALLTNWELSFLSSVIEGARNLEKSLEWPLEIWSTFSKKRKSTLPPSLLLIKNRNYFVMNYKMAFLTLLPNSPPTEVL